MTKQRDPDFDMLTDIELRLRENQEEMMTLIGAAVIGVLCPGFESITVRFSVIDIARMMTNYDIERRFDSDTLEWVLTARRKLDPNQPELPSTPEKRT